MSEEKGKHREQSIEAANIKEAMQALLTSKGWHIISESLTVRRKHLEDTILHQVLSDQNSVFRQEFMKGQAYQLLLLEQLPKVMLTDVEAVLDVLTKLSPEENED